MDKDIFDNGLREKLGNARIEPPSDMWERIAGTLKEKGLTAAETASPVAAVRRKSRLRAGYAAAAAVLIGAVIFGLNRFGDDRVMIAEDITREQPAIITGEPARTAGEQQNEPAQRLAPRGTYNEPLHGEKTVKDDADGTERGKEIAPVTEPVHVTETAPVTGVTSVADTHPVTKTEGVTEPTTADATQPRRQWADREEIERMLNNGKQRKAQSLRLGLYSANIGDRASEKTVQSTPYARVTSDFVVNEISNEAYDGNLLTSTQSTTSLEHKIPLSAGISVTKGIAGRLSLESGATYSYLLSKSESPSSSGGTYNIKQELHYVGIPIGVKYDLLRGGRIDLYTSASGLFEMCVSSRRKIFMKNGDVSGESKTESLNVRGIQPSVAAYAGAEVRLGRNLGLYVEPGVSYYFDIEKQPESYRTENQLNFSFRAGLRISLR